MAAPRHACQGGLAPQGPDFLSESMARQDEERAKRLAEALRENLRRRKVQARGEETAPQEARKGDDPDGTPA